MLIALQPPPHKYYDSILGCRCATLWTCHLLWSSCEQTSLHMLHLENVLSPVKKFPAFNGTRRLSCSQEPVTGLYPELVKSIVHLHTLFWSDVFYYHPPIYPYISQIFSFFQVSQLLFFVCISHLHYAFYMPNPCLFPWFLSPITIFSGSSQNMKLLVMYFSLSSFCFLSHWSKYSPQGFVLTLCFPQGEGSVLTFAVFNTPLLNLLILACVCVCVFIYLSTIKHDLLLWAYVYINTSFDCSHLYIY
jgi:hypothetical protein